MAHKRELSDGIQHPPSKNARNNMKAGSEGGVRQRPTLVPTIRVIQINSPKVVRTDAANFRSTVQMLTGKTLPKSCRGQQRNAATTGGNNHDRKSLAENIDPNKEVQKHEEPSTLPRQQETGGILHQSSDVSSILSFMDSNSREQYMSSNSDVLGLCSSMMFDLSECDNMVTELLFGEPLPDAAMLPPLIDDASHESFRRGSLWESF